MTLCIIEYTPVPSIWTEALLQPRIINTAYHPHGRTHRHCKNASCEPQIMKGTSVQISWHSTLIGLFQLQPTTAACWETTYTRHRQIKHCHMTPRAAVQSRACLAMQPEMRVSVVQIRRSISKRDFYIFKLFDNKPWTERCTKITVFEQLYGLTHFEMYSWH